MPRVGGRLERHVIKELALYVHSLGGGEAAAAVTMDAPETAREWTASAVDQFDVEAVNRRSRQKLYQPRVKIFPKRADGSFRRLKWIVMAVTLGIY